jgi:hypothetical protein
MCMLSQEGHESATKLEPITKVTISGCGSIHGFKKFFKSSQPHVKVWV